MSKIYILTFNVSTDVASVSKHIIRATNRVDGCWMKVLCGSGESYVIEEALSCEAQKIANLPYRRS